MKKMLRKKIVRFKKIYKFLFNANVAPIDILEVKIEKIIIGNK